MCFKMQASLFAIAAAFCGNAALANDATAEADSRDNIIVTGQRDTAGSSGTKSDTPLIATAQSITVLTNDELIRRNALSINQALGYVAGVSANQRGGMVTRYDQLILRGFAPAVFLDGMRLIAGPYSSPQTDFNRIDHIDVVKGPASVLYGNSTPGGVVNVASKTPETTAFQRAELAGGTQDSWRAVADINQPLDKDGKLLLRVVGGWQKSDGFTKYTFSERYHISPMLTFAPGPDTSLTLIAAYQHAPSGGGYSGVPAAGSVLPNPFGALPDDINTGDPGYERYNHKQKAITALFRHDFDDHISIASNARFQNNELSYRQLYVAGFATTGTGAARNSDYSTIIRGGGGADENFDTLTIDNHLSAKFATGPLQHDLMVGIDYQNITGENVQQFNTGQTTNPVTSIPNLNLFAPVYGGTLPPFDLTLLSANYVNSYTRRDQTGLYVQDQVTVGRLHLIASGRYDWYDQTTLNKKNNAVTPFKQNAFTMRVGALYETEAGFSPYASYSESFEPQTGTTYDGIPFTPVTGRQYEAGVKYQPPGSSALFTLAAYDLRRQNVPVSDPRAGTAGIPSTSQVQIGEVAIRGIELEGRGEVFPGFDVIAAASYTDAEITQGAPAIAPTATNSGTPTTTGTRPLGTPKWAASTFLSYDFGKGGQGSGALAGLSLGGGVRYVGGSDGTTTYAIINNVTTFQAFTTKSFTLVDALIGYDLGKASASLEGLSLALNATNLFDTRHVTACPFSNSCYFGSGRAVIGTLRFGF